MTIKLCYYKMLYYKLSSHSEFSLLPRIIHSTDKCKHIKLPAIFPYNEIPLLIFFDVFFKMFYAFYLFENISYIKFYLPFSAMASLP